MTAIGLRTLFPLLVLKGVDFATGIVLFSRGLQQMEVTYPYMVVVVETFFTVSLLWFSG